MPVNLPNLLTWLRIMSIPLLIGVFYCPERWLEDQQRNIIATVLFVAAALTD
jgi:cardiolipin synthase